MTTSQTKGCFLSVMHLHCWKFSYICFSMARRDAADIKGKRPFSYTDAQAHQHKLLSDARSHSAFQESCRYELQPDELTSLNEIRLLSRIPHAFKLDRHFCSMRITLSWSDISARQKNPSISTSTSTAKRHHQRET